MICPVEIARDLSAFRAVRVREHGNHVLLPEGRDGAGDESTGSDFAGHGEADHVVASSGDHRHQRSAHAALARALRDLEPISRVRKQDAETRQPCTSSDAYARNPGAVSGENNTSPISPQNPRYRPPI